MYKLKEKMPEVSVIIPTYNCSKYISEAIDSVLAQTYKEFEIIIIDDGSTDETKGIVQEYLVSHRLKIKYIFQENQGLACARNAGIKNATGKYLALLDADDAWAKNRLALGVEIMEKHPTVSLVHANIFCMNEKGKVLFTAQRERSFLNGKIAKALLLKKAEISCPTVLFRRECVDTVGTFDENLTRLGCEDRELWIRITRQYDAYYIDEPLAYYRQRQSSMSKNMDKMVRAKYYVIHKHLDSRTKDLIIKLIALARTHKDCGDVLLFRKDYRNAIFQYLRSLQFWPFSIWPVINTLKALLCFNIRKINNE